MSRCRRPRVTGATDGAAVHSAHRPALDAAHGPAGDAARHALVHPVSHAGVDPFVLAHFLRRLHGRRELRLLLHHGLRLLDLGLGRHRLRLGRRGRRWRRRWRRGSRLHEERADGAQSRLGKLPAAHQDRYQDDGAEHRDMDPDRHRERDRPLLLARDTGFQGCRDSTATWPRFRDQTPCLAYAWACGSMPRQGHKPGPKPAETTACGVAEAEPRSPGKPGSALSPPDVDVRCGSSERGRRPRSCPRGAAWRRGPPSQR